MTKELFVMLGQQGDCVTADLYELPQIFAPQLCLICAPWYQVEDDDGYLACKAITAIYKFTHELTVPEACDD